MGQKGKQVSKQKKENDELNTVDFELNKDFHFPLDGWTSNQVKQCSPSIWSLFFCDVSVVVQLLGCAIL